MVAILNTSTRATIWGRSKSPDVDAFVRGNVQRVTFVVVRPEVNDPVDDLFSATFLTQDDVARLHALDQSQQPTARGQLLPTRP